MTERSRSRVPDTGDQAVVYVREFGLPVEVVGAFVLNGWKKVATTEEELRHLVAEGQRLSPVGEVTLYWTISEAETSTPA
jgi:hypothetical protein